MPILPEEIFLEAVDQLVSIDRDWIPDGDGSLYIRPFMFANEIFLGVKPSSEYLFIVIASSVGSYFKSAADAVSVWVTPDYTRAAPGGTGAAKCGGNYASSLLAQAEATRNGCDQVVFLDAVERKWVEELGGMNVFFVFNDGSMSTPPLGGTILPGITRSSLLTLAKDKGIAVREERYSYDQWKADAAAAGCASLRLRHGGRRDADRHGASAGGRVQDRQRRARGARPRSSRPCLSTSSAAARPDPHKWVHRVF
jgi:branched-chain amino acid aminotransferase